MTLNNIVKTCAWGLYKSDLRYPERTGWWSKVHPFAQTSSDQGECFVRRPVLCICLYHSVYQMSHQGKCFAFVRRPMLCICIIPFTKCCIRGNALRLYEGQCFVYVSFLLPNVASGEMLCVCSMASALYMYHSFYKMSHQGSALRLYESQCFVSVSIIPFTKTSSHQMKMLCTKGQCFLSTRIFLVCA